MVDVGSKQITRRIACATSKVTLSVEAAHAVRSDTLKKGDCIAVARIAAIQAAKQTSLLIPLCHVLLIDSVEISYEWTSSTELTWKAVVKATGKTGVEMEALTAMGNDHQRGFVTQTVGKKTGHRELYGPVAGIELRKRTVDTVKSGADFHQPRAIGRRRPAIQTRDCIARHHQDKHQAQASLPANHAPRLEHG